MYTQINSSKEQQILLGYCIEAATKFWDVTKKTSFWGVLFRRVASYGDNPDD